jgi:hypothetical protein
MRKLQKRQEGRMPVSGMPAISPEELQERRLKVTKYRIAGWSWQRIGDACGISDSQAHKDFHAEMDRRNREMNETLDEAKRVELIRLDSLVMWWSERAEHSLEAAEFLLKVQNRRARLLGLDAPVKREVDLTDKRDLAKLSPAEAIQRLTAIRQRLLEAANPNREKLLETGASPVIEAEKVTQPIIAFPDDGVKD